MARYTNRVSHPTVVVNKGVERREIEEADAVGSWTSGSVHSAHIWPQAISHSREPSGEDTRVRHSAHMLRTAQVNIVPYRTNG